MVKYRYIPFSFGQPQSLQPQPALAYTQTSPVRIKSKHGIESFQLKLVKVILSLVKHISSFLVDESLLGFSMPLFLPSCIVCCFPTITVGLWSRPWPKACLRKNAISQLNMHPILKILVLTPHNFQNVRFSDTHFSLARFFIYL